MSRCILCLSSTWRRDSRSVTPLAEAWAWSKAALASATSLAAVVRCRLTCTPQHQMFSFALCQL